MFRFGQPEVDAVAQVAFSGRLFRYQAKGQCGRFERRFARMLGAPHARMTASGTIALTAALVGAGIGPGDEVLVPAHTFMASALAVLGAGAIPVIVDVDESITMDPAATADAVGPRTRAIMPVHMWGTVCDMNALMRVSRRRKLVVIEDCAQCVGGVYRGRKVGTFGRAAGFSFNYYKNMTCGEGGLVVTADKATHQRAECFVDPCMFYWTGRKEDFRPYCAVGARSSEFEGAMLNAQLDRLPGMLRQLRRAKAQLLNLVAPLAPNLKPAPNHSPDGECASHALFNLPSAAEAEQFSELAKVTLLSRTGRHNYTEWDPILDGRGSHHPALDPFRLPANRRCRKKYCKDMLPDSLAIVSRSVMVGLHPDMKSADVKSLAARLATAASQVFGSGD